MLIPITAVPLPPNQEIAVAGWMTPQIDIGWLVVVISGGILIYIKGVDYLAVGNILS